MSVRVLRHVAYLSRYAEFLCNSIRTEYAIAMPKTHHNKCRLKSHSLQNANRPEHDAPTGLLPALSILDFYINSRKADFRRGSRPAAHEEDVASRPQRQVC